jgi:hypothetical protein
VALSLLDVADNDRSFSSRSSSATQGGQACWPAIAKIGRPVLADNCNASSTVGSLICADATQQPLTTNKRKHAKRIMANSLSKRNAKHQHCNRIGLFSLGLGVLFELQNRVPQRTPAMSIAKCSIPMFLLLIAFCGTSNAQLSVPMFKTTYCVQVEHEMWRNGRSYWSTEYETSNQAEAQLIYQLFEAALESGSLCEMLGCDFDWIIVDVRLKTKHEWFLQIAPTWNLQNLQSVRQLRL